MTSIGRRLVVIALIAGVSAAAAPLAQRPRVARPMLHAHNCYPEDGRWADRIDRALSTGLLPIAIEQDLVWAPQADGPGRSLVSHDGPITGIEPTLEDYFFRRLQPQLDRLLAANRRDTWPLIVLHLDFKTNEREHHRAIWELLGRYERWLTTAPRTFDELTPQPLSLGPLLVLTENGDGQSQIFHDAVPIGGRLRLFGTIPSAPLTAAADPEARAQAAIDAPPSSLIPATASNYRRWVNFAWAVVERGGQAQAGDWTSADATRLETIVDRAHESGLWIRFYTLNGHAPEASMGWTASYNFGSLAAVELRWRAAIAAGVDFIATDQYESFAASFKRVRE